MTHNHKIFYLGGRVVKNAARGPLYGHLTTTSPPPPLLVPTMVSFQPDIAGAFLECLQRG